MAILNYLRLPHHSCLLTPIVMVHSRVVNKMHPRSRGHALRLDALSDLFALRHLLPVEGFLHPTAIFIYLPSKLTYRDPLPLHDVQYHHRSRFVSNCPCEILISVLRLFLEAAAALRYDDINGYLGLFDGAPQVRQYFLYNTFHLYLFHAFRVDRVCFWTWRCSGMFWCIQCIHGSKWCPSNTSSS